MTMRAVIAMPTTTDPLPRPDAPPQGLFRKLFGIRPRPAFKGVYLHNGGPPSEVGPIFFRFVQERGIERAWNELIVGNPAGWSSLSYFWEAESCRKWDGTKVDMRTHEANQDEDKEDAGPVSYQGDPQRDLGFPSPPITESTDKMGAVSTWVLCRGELVLFAVEENGVALREVDRFAWNAEPDWESVDEKFDSALEG